jgi:ribosomal protein S12 methylthiotransferase accessory factor YcaO
LEKTYYCTVDNVDPGAVIARAKGATREEAEAEAIAKAKERLLQTRVFQSEHYDNLRR